jgi:cytidyltransferase-like protein|tara:strand:- start:25534 stop:26844 length:1311 start_codon:yes stop_codon:yes gene_type:complete
MTHTVVLCTGGFDPLHPGHIDYLNEAKSLGDVLAVGINSDSWLTRKKGKAFLPQDDRVRIVENLKTVDHCILFNDDDDTAIQAIYNVKFMYPASQIIFANGGDRLPNNTPEQEMFKNDSQVRFEFGAGGSKSRSSSWILENWATTVKILLTNDTGTSDYALDFKLSTEDIARKWLHELEEFIEYNAWVDDPERFYNFPNSKYTESYVRKELNKTVQTINKYSPNLVDTYVGKPDQDRLNYLHHIFEEYHGLYDQQQSNKFFRTAPEEVKLALRNLNILIHRYESLGDIPRLVGTWYGKPQRKELAQDDFNQFTLAETWGTMYINYCEVGKTLFDLYHDNDQYIDPIAFKPLAHYSMDFTVRFTDKDRSYYQKLEEEVWNYHDKHIDFFAQQGYSPRSPRLSLGLIPVAQLVERESRNMIITNIGLHQHIKSISISK